MPECVDYVQGSKASFLISLETQRGRNSGKLNMSSPSLKGKILGNRWKLGALLGKGACADVYEATHVRGGEEEAFAAKVVPVPQGLPPRMNKAGKKRSFTEQERDVNMIYYEHTLYHGWLRDHGGVAKVCESLRQFVIDTVNRLCTPPPTPCGSD